MQSPPQYLLGDFVRSPSPPTPTPHAPSGPEIRPLEPVREPPFVPLSSPDLRRRTQPEWPLSLVDRLPMLRSGVRMVRRMTDASARTHPTVTLVTSALRERGATGTVRWLAESVTTAAAAAAALGIEPGAIASSLVFTLDRTPILVMTAGAHRVDTKWLGAALGGKLRRADPDTVRAATGQAIGGVAPVGHPRALQTFVDESLAA